MTAAIETKNATLVQVAIPLAIDDPYDYAVPDELVSGIKLGVRVRVPLKNRDIIGYAVGIRQDAPSDGTKKIAAILDTEPILSSHLIELTQWMRNNYFSSWGEAIHNILPKKYRQRPVRPKKSKVNESVLTGEHHRKFITLTGEQEEAVGLLNRLLESGQPHRALLFGVTGSGKSEVYIRAIQTTLRLGRTAICLVPEIALTEQLELFFQGYFQGQLEILHSKLSDGERFRAWERIRKGERKVVLGARSAIFAPFENLGLIVIDEEQEPSYKQDQTPRYHAREVAQWRTEKMGAVLLLGTATPSMESLHDAMEGRMQLIRLTRRVDSRSLPDIEIVDLKQAQALSRDKVIISNPLAEAIRVALTKKEGVLLLLNRRGFSTQAQCLQCGKPILCRHCDVALTYHQEDHQMLCHYCNFHMDDSGTCPYCQHALFKFSGFGTEKLESEVARLFPTARIARFDSDTIRKKGSHEHILASFRARQLDILVGTQMIAKGFDFSHVTLVGVVVADTALVLPDFRSSEKTFQLITQVAGRSGRGAAQGRVFVQTYLPQHYSIQLAKAQNATRFYERESEFRRQFRYPPFVRLVNVMIRGKNESKVVEQASLLKAAFTQAITEQDVDIIGPAPLPFYRLRGHYRWHVMIKSPDASSSPVIAQMKQALRQTKRVSRVHLAVDVNPVTIL